VIALDVSPERLERARAFGAAETINPKSDDPIAAIKQLTHGLGAELTLETSGAPSARQQAVRSTKTWGTSCYVGEGDTVTLEVSPDMLRRQLTLIASWTFSTVIQAECARFVADRKIDVDHLFTDRWKLGEAREAYQKFDRQTAGKGVFLM
jgi:threonine dehydrogenase-like Zn-dependent dehydrogenase